MPLALGSEAILHKQEIGVALYKSWKSQQKGRL